MTFEKTLEEICGESPGAIAALVMNTDGLVVARHDAGADGLDAEAVLVELLSALKAARQAAGQAGGSLREICIDLERVSVVLRPLGEEHFAALVLAAQAVGGKGRFALRRRTRELRSELA